MTPVLTYYDIAQDVTAFSTTRHGGVSKGNYGEFNINTYCGDTPEAIAVNRKALEVTLGIDDDKLIMAHQVHSVKARVVSPSMLSLSPESRCPLLEGVDCLITHCKDVCIGVSTADCTPVLLYDAAHHVAAAVHAGWRGTLKQMVVRSLQTMGKEFMTRPNDVVAVIGPCISLENFEVGQEVFDYFAGEGFDMDAIARRFPSFEEEGEEKWHIDLPLCNGLQLEGAGVLRKNIVQTGICTYSHVEDYFSARRLGIKSGRIYTGIILH